MTSNLSVKARDDAVPGGVDELHPSAHLLGDHLGGSTSADVLALLVGHLEGLIAGIEADPQHTALQHGIQGGSGRGVGQPAQQQGKNEFLIIINDVSVVNVVGLEPAPVRLMAQRLHPGNGSRQGLMSWSGQKPHMRFYEWFVG